jgi:hypothetical protein
MHRGWGDGYVHCAGGATSRQLPWSWKLPRLRAGRAPRFNPIEAGSTDLTSLPARILRTFLKSSSDVLEEPLRFHAAASRSPGDGSMQSTNHDRVIEPDNP